MSLLYTLAFPNLFVCFIYSLHSVFRLQAVKRGKDLGFLFLLLVCRVSGTIGHDSRFGFQGTTIHTINNNSYYEQVGKNNTFAAQVWAGVKTARVVFTCVEMGRNVDIAETWLSLYLVGHVTVPGYKNTVITFKEGH